MVVTADIAQLLELIEALQRENKILREEVAILKQGLFGRRSERIDPSQLGLYGSEERDQSAAQAAASLERQAPKQEKPKGHGRPTFAADVPRETTEVAVPEEQRSCAECGEAMRRIGEEVTERGHFVPARIVVRRWVREKLACPKGHGVVTAKAPAALIRRCKYEPSVYAHVVASKYADHLPLHRMQGIFKRHGVHLPKQTMWDMLVTVDELVAQPVLEQMRLELLEEPVLHSDESPVTMRLEDGKGSKETWAWSWRSLREGVPRKVLVRFETRHSKEAPKTFLGSWAGTLVADGTSVQDEVVAANGIVRAGCWAHARRYFKQAFDAGSKTAALVLVPMQRLFRLDRAINRRADRLELDLAARRELRARVRARRSVPLVRRIYQVANDLVQDRHTLPRGKLGKALGYLEGQRERLEVFLTEPRVPLTNNLRARPPARLGRPEQLAGLR